MEWWDSVEQRCLLKGDKLKYALRILLSCEIYNLKN